MHPVKHLMTLRYSYPQFTDKQASTERLSYRLEVTQQVSTDQAGGHSKAVVPSPVSWQHGMCMHLRAVSSVCHPTTPINEDHLSDLRRPPRLAYE